MNGLNPVDYTCCSLFLPFVVIWMTICILKYGKPQGRTFDDYLYDD